MHDCASTLALVADTLDTYLWPTKARRRYAVIAAELRDQAAELRKLAR